MKRHKPATPAVWDGFCGLMIAEQDGFGMFWGVSSQTQWIFMLMSEYCMHITSKGNFLTYRSYGARVYLQPFFYKYIAPTELQKIWEEFEVIKNLCEYVEVLLMDITK